MCIAKDRTKVPYFSQTYYTTTTNSNNNVVVTRERVCMNYKSHNNVNRLLGTIIIRGTCIGIVIFMRHLHRFFDKSDKIMFLLKSYIIIFQPALVLVCKFRCIMCRNISAQVIWRLFIIYGYGHNCDYQKIDTL